MAQELTGHSTLDKEHVARSMGSGPKPGPSGHCQGPVAGPFTPLSLFPRLKREQDVEPASGHTCTVPQLPRRQEAVPGGRV